MKVIKLIIGFIVFIIAVLFCPKFWKQREEDLKQLRND